MSSMLNKEFKASVYVSEKLNRSLINISEDLVYRCIKICGEMYNFDAEEASRLLGLEMIKVERKKVISKVKVEKACFPLPYNGELNDDCCKALRHNNGLYTQCTGLRVGGDFCKSCTTTMKKSCSEVPEYGTIEQRMATGIFEYVDPKGRKPIAYTKVMKKYKISEEQVMMEASKLNLTINPGHFVVPESESVKRGRPKTAKEPKSKGVKGRPKKEKKVLMIEGENSDDLFASLVASANNDSDEISIIKSKKSDEERAEKEAEKEAKRLAAEVAKKEKESKLAAEKEAKRVAAEVAKKEKESKLAAEKAEKELKKEQERLAREAKKAEEEAAKKALAQKKEEQRLKDKADKELKKSSKKSAAAVDAEEDEEPDVVKKVEFEGKKYLKSKKTGIIYDYNEYVNNSEQVIVGKWNDSSNKIDFAAAEEEEEEYDD